MKKAWAISRKKMMDKFMEDEEYRKQSYDPTRKKSLQKDEDFVRY